jgi:hypothetical protein
MRDKALSNLDSDISNILNSDVSDELKAKSYAASLSRFRSYSSPPSLPAVEKPVEQRAVSTPQSAARPRERHSKDRRSRRAQWLDSDDSQDDSPSIKEKFGAQWIDKTPAKKKKKIRRKNKTWVQY